MARWAQSKEAAAGRALSIRTVLSVASLKKKVRQTRGVTVPGFLQKVLFFQRSAAFRSPEDT